MVGAIMIRITTKDGWLIAKISMATMVAAVVAVMAAMIPVAATIMIAAAMVTYHDQIWIGLAARNRLNGLR